MKKVTSHDPLQPGYVYYVNDDRQYHSDFTPDYTPVQCIAMGIFGGAYFRDYPLFVREFPHLKHQIQPDEVVENNYFGVYASMSRRDWQKRGWMHDDDPRGWFQWFCRYDMGRRHEDDDRQIERWKRFKKRKLREIGNSVRLEHHSRTRQGLLHWGIASPGMVGHNG